MEDKYMEMTVEQMSAMSEDEYVCIDMRSEIAYQHGHIPGAVWWDSGIPMAEGLPEEKKLIVYCSYGDRSRELVPKLSRGGFEAYNLAGGYREWLLHHFGELDTEEVRRYDRQIILPQIGSEGQIKLKNSRVLVVGAGGLGSPAALYLAGAGVGTVGIMDADTVNMSNLQRQILHNIDREQMNKAESAKLSLERLNDKIEVRAYPYMLSAENAEEIIREYDFIIDGTDNFETKFLINDICVSLGKSFCHGGILQFTGQVMTYVPGDCPCYRCVFEEAPERGSLPNCSQAGVIGAVAGIIGSIQALEAMKYLLGMGGLLTGKILVIDGLTMRMRRVSINGRNKNCKACGALK